MKFHFHKDNVNFTHMPDEDTEILEFMAMNLEESIDPYANIHNKFKEKSSWKPPMTHQSLEVFQRAFKQG